MFPKYLLSQYLTTQRLCDIMSSSWTECEGPHKLRDIGMAADETNENELLTDVKGTAMALHVSEATIWRGIRSNVVPVVRIAGRSLIPIEWVKDLASGSETWQAS